MSSSITLRKNVLLIIVDDLRPNIRGGDYGQAQMLTPNMDALAEEGIVFTKAYCQQAICGPTRNSFLSGRRPQRTLAWNFLDHFRTVGPDWISFPQYFKQHNYTTLGTGKTFHPGLPPNNDEPLSWSQDEDYYSAPNAYPDCERWPHSYVCPTSEPWDVFSDYLNMNRTREQIFKYANRSNPFFLTFGAHRPHLPFHVPKEFWDRYGATENISLPKHESAPSGMPPIAFTYECDGKTVVTALDDEAPIPYPNASTALPDNMTRTLRRGYYASVSWTDHLIGELLRALDEAGVANDTIVALIGDHGWQLGEHNIWGKHTNFELGTRVPFMIRVPGTRPFVSDALVESVDLYPTIASLAGVGIPADLDGLDLSPLIRRSRTTLKDAVFSEYPRCPTNISTPWDDSTSCVETPRERFTAMGYSVRTKDWRYTLWLHWDGAALRGDFSRPAIGVELYNHAGDDGRDFDTFENVNLADDDAYASVREKLHAIALDHWGGTDRNRSLPITPRPTEDESESERDLRLERW